MSRLRRLAVLADRNGRVVAAHFIGEHIRQDATRIKTGMGTLPGQTLHEVELPTELADAETEEVLVGVAGYRITAGVLTRKES